VVEVLTATNRLFHYSNWNSKVKAAVIQMHPMPKKLGDMGG
jgi:hypothetical protein